ncbi:peptidoglycan DD-metalloendopeptidase family protein [Paenibacillus sp. JX-17]|uniref:Peptidoglycan DD-metalloendopeptidase family protein n=1 Tax=Paenibacillus lacisoli TaxID=3064525 RepID=A0ABT9CG09_9BACL|nr:peptidoglycan DD-metalloendopeptidase family protein [Paenibacillus sp. JX-17]MDO7906611.1 peptidoglycan DD-metalloendopeptidase family protein [Paenibacillus sp. JX-17]
MKRTAALAAVTLLASLIIQPSNGYAKSMNEIDQQLNQLDQQAHKAKQEQKNATENKQEAQHYKNKTTQTLEDVLGEIESVGSQLTRVSRDIEQTEENLRTTKKELAEAEERIKAREKLLETRVRLMYTDGNVSYLDVLLSSTSFSDFLDRADSLKMIVDQDQQLLDEHKKDKEYVVQKQEELEGQYKYVKGLYAQKQEAKDMLAGKEKEKRVLIAGYDQKIEQFDSLSNEQNDLLVALATKRSSLVQEKNQLRAEQEARAKAAREKAAAAAAAKKRALAAQKQSSQSSSSSEASDTTYASSYNGGGGAFAMPVSGARISSTFGYRVHPVTGVRKLHAGVDLAVPQGTSVHAAEDGVVTVAEWWNGYGNLIIIDHGNGLWSMYGHLRDGGIMVSSGQTVKRGQKIAESGSTGVSTGPHLHFEVRLHNVPVNPMDYL